MLSSSTMSEIPGRDDLSKEELRRFAYEAVDWMVSYLTSFGDRPIQPSDPPARVFSLLREPLPEAGSAPSDYRPESRCQPTFTSFPSRFTKISVPRPE